MTKYNSIKKNQKSFANTFSAAIFALAAVGGCGEPSFRAALVVEEGAGVQSLDTTPWPSDLFRDANGHIALTTLPTNANTLTPMLLKDLSENEDGFGTTSGAFFPMSDQVSPGTLDGNIALYGLDTGESIPVYAYFRKDDKPSPRIYVRPANGNVLLENKQYAYIITRNVKSTSGVKLAPSDDLNDLLFGNGTARGKAVYNPLLSLLDGRGVSLGGIVIGRADVAAATVFTTHSVTKRLQFVRDAMTSQPAPVAQVNMVFSQYESDAQSLNALLGTPAANTGGLDNAGGIAHDKIAYVIQGTMLSPDYINTTNTINYAGGGTLTELGTFNETAMQPQVRQMATVPFTLVLPASNNYANTRVVIFQHGLATDRSAVMGVANQLASANLATLAIDAPFHGGRAVGATDNKHTFVAATNTADGWAEWSIDPTNAFFDALGTASNPAFWPASVRAQFMQGAIDIMQEARLITDADADVSQIATAINQPLLSFDHDHVGITGDSFGGILTGVATPMIPNAGAAFNVAAGGGVIFPMITNSPTYGLAFQGLLDAALGTNTAGSSAPADTDFAYNLMQQLIESGDSLAYAPYMVRQPLAAGTPPVNGAPKNTVLVTDYLDERIPNQAQEALGKGEYMQPLSFGGAMPNLAYWPNAPALGTVPVSGNVMSVGATVTAAFIQYQLATSTLFLDTAGVRTKDFTTPYPYKSLAMPMSVTNPISAVQTMCSSFMNDYFTGIVPAVPQAL